MTKYFCIYQITNKINGKRYIGQHHYYNENDPMGKYKGSGVLLHKAYEKHGIENFTIEILYKRILNKETADAMEIYAISKFSPEYNLTKGGTGGDTSRNKKPYKHSDATREKLRQAWVRRRAKGLVSPPNKGTHLSEEQRKHLSEVQKGKSRGPHSEETKRKISEANKGKVRSDEVRKQLSERMKASHGTSGSFKKGHIPWIKGKHWSEEMKRKMSESRKRYFEQRRLEQDEKERS